MTLDALNKQWARLDGWKSSSNIRGFEIGNRRYSWKDGNGKGRHALPDFTEPNRFFSEMVPRMREFNWVVGIDAMSQTVYWYHRGFKLIQGNIEEIINGDIIIPLMKAAINLRIKAKK